MSVIDTATPTGGESLALGAMRAREFRTWILDAYMAFAERFDSAGGIPIPSISTGAFFFPDAAPAAPSVGDMYVTPTGLIYAYKTGPALQLLGDFAVTTKKLFRQSTAPVGWTRDASLQTDSVIRYLSSGSPSQGGTLGPFTVSHSFSLVSQLAGGTSLLYSTLNNHQLRYNDVIIATK